MLVPPRVLQGLRQRGAVASRYTPKDKNAPGVKVPQFGGAQDGRQLPADPNTIPPMWIKVKGPSLTPGRVKFPRRSSPQASNLTARNKRAKDPGAIMRRKARQKLGVADIRNASPAQIKALRRNGLLGNSPVKDKGTRRKLMAMGMLPRGQRPGGGAYGSGSRQRSGGIYDAVRNQASRRGPRASR